MFFDEKTSNHINSAFISSITNLCIWGSKTPKWVFFELYDNEKTWKAVELYFSGLVSGVTWSNTLNNNLGKTTVFCSPSKNAITAEEGYLVYKNEYLSNQETWDKMPYQPAGLIFTVGLQTKYPCLMGKLVF